MYVFFGLPTTPLSFFSSLCLLGTTTRRHSWMTPLPIDLQPVSSYPGSMCASARGLMLLGRTTATIPHPTPPIATACFSVCVRPDGRTVCYQEEDYPIHWFRASDVIGDRAEVIVWPATLCSLS